MKKWLCNNKRIRSTKNNKNPNTLQNNKEFCFKEKMQQILIILRNSIKQMMIWVLNQKVRVIRIAIIKNLESKQRKITYKKIQNKNQLKKLRTKMITKRIIIRKKNLNKNLNRMIRMNIKRNKMIIRKNQKTNMRIISKMFMIQMNNQLQQIIN